MRYFTICFPDEVFGIQCRYFIPTEHFNSDQPHFQYSVVACGQWLPKGTEQEGNGHRYLERLQSEEK